MNSSMQFVAKVLILYVCICVYDGIIRGPFWDRRVR